MEATSTIKTGPLVRILDPLALVAFDTAGSFAFTLVAQPRGDISISHMLGKVRSLLKLSFPFSKSLSVSSAFLSELAPLSFGAPPPDVEGGLRRLKLSLLDFLLRAIFVRLLRLWAHIVILTSGLSPSHLAGANPAN